MYIRHIDTGEVRPQLPKGFNAFPTGWFPDGTHLLLTSAGAAQGRPGLWKVSILGDSPQQLMENASEAAISPDGSKIAFLRGDALGSLEIWVMGTDGSNLHQIATLLRRGRRSRWATGRPASRLQVSIFPVWLVRLTEGGWLTCGALKKEPDQPLWRPNTPSKR